LIVAEAAGPTLPPLTEAEWPAAIADMRAGFAGKLNIYRVMAHNPALLRAWTGLRQHVVIDSALTEQQREIVILRVGHRWASSYEWRQHVARGRDAGLSDARIASARGAPESWAAGEDTALMHAVDALLDRGRLDRDQHDSLLAFLTQAAIIDLMATVGMYTTLAFLANSFAVPIDDDIGDRGELA
jgi:4-carboxymuconolactone decarboxylase